MNFDPSLNCGGHYNRHECFISKLISCEFLILNAWKATLFSNFCIQPQLHCLAVLQLCPCVLNSPELHSVWQMTRRNVAGNQRIIRKIANVLDLQFQVNF